MSRWVPLCTAEWYGDGAETLEAKTVRQYRIWQTHPDIPEDERESTTCATRLRARDHATGEVRDINYYVHIAGGKKVKQAKERARINAEARILSEFKLALLRISQGLECRMIMAGSDCNFAEHAYASGRHPRCTSRASSHARHGNAADGI